VSGPPDNREGVAPHRPVLAVSMGDPSGIGPEIIVKALADRVLRQRARYRVFGSSRAMDATARAAGITPYWWRIAHDADAAMIGAALHHDVLVLDYPEFDVEPGSSEAEPARPGPSAAGGAASFRWVEDAIVAAKHPVNHPMHADAIVTAPISKTSWTMAGGAHKQFPGHTELLAHRLHAKRHGMLFVGPSLRVMLVTIHIPLMAVGPHLTTRRVLDAIELAAQSCREMGMVQPRIAVCGLNPHAGEGGILGDEDERVIRPAVAMAGEKGIDATGPWPADTLFLAAAAPPHGKGMYDCVVAMYHDQGLIPVKLLDREKAVNVTVGLPTVRTSPAHGTAFDIAGMNRADAGSMRAAVEVAIGMAESARGRRG
jgi:4-hydroxythreonine-4-phosphate dehydrogenase